MAQDIALGELHNGAAKEMQVRATDRATSDLEYDIAVLENSWLWSID
jgi:hypothetical protein